MISITGPFQLRMCIVLSYHNRFALHRVRCFSKEFTNRESLACWPYNNGRWFGVMWQGYRFTKSHRMSEISILRECERWNAGVICFIEHLKWNAQNLISRRAWKVDCKRHPAKHYCLMLSKAFFRHDHVVMTLFKSGISQKLCPSMARGNLIELRFC